MSILFRVYSITEDVEVGKYETQAEAEAAAEKTEGEVLLLSKFAPFSGLRASWWPLWVYEDGEPLRDE